MRGMGPGILDNPPRPIYPKAVEDLVTDLLCGHASIRVIDDLCARMRVPLTTHSPDTRPGTRSTSEHWHQSIVIDIARPSLMSWLPIRALAQTDYVGEADRNF
jgi:hypothetical protein